MSSPKPILSVIMSVYNAEKYLEEAINSVLNQTFDDFEFIIIDDASTDSSIDIINSFKDSRIILIQKKENKGFKGFVENLNLGLDKSNGIFIARMDADDICYLNRFQIQVDYLQNNPHIFMVGNNMDLIDENNQFLRKESAILGFKKIVKNFNYRNPMYHPTLMFRNTSIRYRNAFIGCEDFDFHLQHLSEGLLFENINQSLIKYRILNQSISRSVNKLLILIAMETARDQFLDRKKGVINSDESLLIRYQNNKLNDLDKKNILLIALKYNYNNFNDLFQKLNIQSSYLSIFQNSFFRILYSQFSLKFSKKIKL